jgi:hypothetical protein
MFLPVEIVHAQASKPFSGRVFEANTRRGIPNLEVKLRPPSGSTNPIVMGTTNQNGVFSFPEVKVGVYLVEVSQGPYLLYRGEVDISKRDNINIPIERR